MLLSWVNFHPYYSKLGTYRQEIAIWLRSKITFLKIYYWMIFLDEKDWNRLTVVDDHPATLPICSPEDLVSQIGSNIGPFCMRRKPRAGRTSLVDSQELPCLTRAGKAHHCTPFRRDFHGIDFQGSNLHRDVTKRSIALLFSMVLLKRNFRLGCGGAGG